MEISISISSDAILFAESKGWTKTLITFKESAVEGRIQVEEDNTISAEQFCCDYFKRIVINEFSSIEIGLINQSFDEQKKAQIDALQNQLNEAVSVELK